MSSSSPTTRWAWVALASAAQLALEILFVKLTRYELGTLSLLVLGLALLGVAFAGPLAVVLGGGVRAGERACVALLVAALGAGAYLFALPHAFTSMAATGFRAVVTGIVCFVPLCLSGVPFYVEVSRGPEHARPAYVASLVGATTGALVIFAALHVFGDRGAYAVAVAAVAILACATTRRLRVVGACGLVLAFASPSALGALDRRAHPGSVAIHTNAFSRLDVIPRPDGTFQLRTAGLNGSTSTPPGTARNPGRKLAHTLAAVPFVGGGERALLIGTGGGRNVSQALFHGVGHVTAVEINGMIPEVMRARLPVERDPYRDPVVRLVVGEGREVASRLARDPAERFDLVYVPIATLFGSSGHAFTQTYLMTEEAFASYAALLREGGAIAVYSPSPFRPKVVAALAHVLRARGVSSVEAHMLVYGAGDRFVVLASPSRPIADARRDAIAARIRDAHVVPVREDLERARRMHRLTDDNAFLYNDVETLAGVRNVMAWNARFLEIGFFVSLALLALTGAWAIARAPASASRADVAYDVVVFATMGAAYSVLQTGLVQRLGFLVGHPLLATVVVLPSSLLGTACGGALAASHGGRWGAAVVSSTTLAALVGVLCFLPSGDLLGVSASWWTRGALGAAVSFAVFASIGRFFPTASARVAATRPGDLARVWAVNGVASVVGAIVAVYGAMSLGFAVVMLVTVGAYVALAIAEARRGART